MPDRARYRTEGGEPVIDVHIASLEHLFDNRDPAPFRERDLDPHLAEYLLDAGDDLVARGGFRVVFWLGQACPPAELETAVRAYFGYELERLDRKRRRQRRVGQIALLLAVLLIIALMSVGELVASVIDNPVGLGLKEGLVISSWVLMWRPVEVLVYDWIPWRRQRRVLKRLLEVPIDVRTGPGPRP